MFNPADLAHLIEAALHSPGLMPPNEFNLSRYSLSQHTRNRLLDPDISALEDYLIDHSNLPGESTDLVLLHAFGDVVRTICHSENTPLRVGYQHMAWLLAWLNLHHPPSFFGEDPDSPLQMLQMCAALGIGEWAAHYNQIEGGIADLFTLANSPLWRVRAAAALGLARMLNGAWARTSRRYRYYVTSANAREWQAILTSVSLFEQFTAAQVIDALDLYQQAFRFIGEQENGKVAGLCEEIPGCLVRVIEAAPALGFAYLLAWAQWKTPAVQGIIQQTIGHLDQWGEQVEQIRRVLP